MIQTMFRKISLILVLVLSSLSLTYEAYTVEIGGEDDNPFILYYEEGPLEYSPGTSQTYEFLVQIPPKFYLYEEKLDIKIESSGDIQIADFVKPEAVQKEDKFFNRILPVYFNEVVASLQLNFPEGISGEQKILGEFRYQGCSDKLCYKHMKIPFEIVFISSDHSIDSSDSTIQNKTQGNKIITDDSKGSSSFIDQIKNFIKNPDFESATKATLWFAIFMAFVGGVLTDLTPCVWPMIPVTLAIIGVRKDRSLAKSLLAILVLVLGMAVMYSILGVAAAFFGKSLGFLFQSRIFIVLMVLVLVAMGLSLLGLFEIKIPSSLQNKIARVSSDGYHGIFFVGLTLGLMASPCVGPIVGPLLVFVAQSQDMSLGFILLLSYAFGMGMIFFILGILYHSFQVRLKSGPWLGWFKKFLGIILLAVSLYYAHTLYASITSSEENQKESYIINNITDGLEKAQKESKPLIIDFYALWCPPCLELDKFVFKTEEIKKKFKEDWVFVKIDCTEETEVCEEAVDRFNVYGWPTVVFLDREQKEVKSERIEGRVVSKEEMLEIMDRIEK